jgi:hypothetical protein
MFTVCRRTAARKIPWAMRRTSFLLVRKKTR